MSLINSQVRTNNYYIFDSAGMDELRSLLWRQDDLLETLFSVDYMQRSSLIVKAMFFPFMIDFGQIGTTVNKIKMGYTNYNVVSNIIKLNPILIAKSIEIFFSFDDTLYNKTDSFIDYPTFTEYKIYLPYIGIVDIDGTLIYNNLSNIGIRYSVDVTTGAMSCIIYLTESTNILYQFEVNAVSYISLNGTDNKYLANKALSIASSVVSAASGFVIPNVTNRVSTTKTTQRNPKTGRQITAGTTQQTESFSSYSARNGVASIINGLETLSNSRIPTSIRSELSGNIAFDSLLTPTIIIKKPKVVYYNNYEHFQGKPANATHILKDVKGYTEIDSIHLQIPCLNDELEEIESLLKSGVIINNGTPTPEPPTEPTTPVEPEPPEPEPEPEPPTPEPDPEPDPEPPEEYRPYEEGKEMICCFNGRFRVTSPRDWRTLNGVRDYHKGIDLVGEDSHVVYAICDGYCTTRTEYNQYGKVDGFGNYVTQTIADGRRIFYAHLASFSIMDNQYVKAGTPIGIMGETGNVTGAHTHLELRPAGTTSESLDINAFTGIPNVVGNYTGVPTYVVAESAELQAKVGLENQTMEYLNDYEYAEDLVRKLNDKIE